jgi:hypothetical protein
MIAIPASSGAAVLRTGQVRNTVLCGHLYWRGTATLRLYNWVQVVPPMGPRRATGGVQFVASKYFGSKQAEQYRAAQRRARRLHGEPE